MDNILTCLGMTDVSIVIIVMCAWIANHIWHHGNRTLETSAGTGDVDGTASTDLNFFMLVFLALVATTVYIFFAKKLFGA